MSQGMTPTQEAQAQKNFDYKRHRQRESRVRVIQIKQTATGEGAHPEQQPNHVVAPVQDQDGGGRLPLRHLYSNDEMDPTMRWSGGPWKTAKKV